MAAENSSGLVVAEEAPHIVDASEEDDFLDTDTNDVGLGLLERLPAAAPVPVEQTQDTAADFGPDKARFYAPVPWQQHSPAELPLTQTDWIEWDGGKVGGRPVWLFPEAAPAASDMSCSSCAKRMRFIAQVSAPAEAEEVGHSGAFHRMLYVFACASAACVRAGAVRVLRAQLPRDNAYYASDLDRRSVAPASLPEHPCLAQPRAWCSVCGFSAGGTHSPEPSTADATHILTPLAAKAFAKVQGGAEAPAAPKAAVSQLLQWLSSEGCPARTCCGECSTVLAQWLLARALACAALVCAKPATASSLTAALDGVLRGWAGCTYSGAVYMPLAALVPTGAVFAEHAMYTDAEPGLDERRAAAQAKDAGLVDRHAKLWGGEGGAAAATSDDSASGAAGAAQAPAADQDMDISDTTQAELLAASGGRLQADLEMRAFKQRVAHVPGQVLRFCRWSGAQPLWVGSAGKPRSRGGVQGGVAPPCACGAPRDFELQIMPQVLDALQVPARVGSGGAHDELDFATIAVYSCTASCDNEGSASEWVHTQTAETHMSQAAASN